MNWLDEGIDFHRNWVILHDYMINNIFTSFCLIVALIFAASLVFKKGKG